MPRSINVFAASVSSHFGKGAENFGDNLMEDLLGGLFNLKVNYVKHSRAQLLGVGSILDAYQRRKSVNRVPVRSRRPWRTLHVWGSGFMDSSSHAIWPQRLKLHAVRGPLTAERVEAGDLSLGDPALLLPLIFPAKNTPRYEVGVIPHFATWKTFRDSYESYLPKNWAIINLLQKPGDICSAISSCDMIISSSLHGIIVADAYNVPSIWMSADNRIKGDGFKFRDYAAQRCLPLNNPITFGKVLNEGIPHSEFAAAPPSRECIDRLISSFPFR